MTPAITPELRERAGSLNPQHDLFRAEHALTPAERRRLKGGPQAKGYAAQPGTGPAGETCGSCDHLVRKSLAKVYRKCGLMRAHWTGGKATDVLASAPACRNWKPLDAPPATPLATGEAENPNQQTRLSASGARHHGGR